MSGKRGLEENRDSVDFTASGVMVGGELVNPNLVIIGNYAEGEMHDFRLMVKLSIVEREYRELGFTQPADIVARITQHLDQGKYEGMSFFLSLLQNRSIRTDIQAIRSFVLGRPAIKPSNIWLDFDQLSLEDDLVVINGSCRSFSKWCFRGMVYGAG